MPEVSGSLTDIVGATMGSRQGELFFRLNEPSIQAGSSIPGTIHPTAEHRIVPAADGSFTVNLRSTTTMLNDAWYILRIEWLDGMGGPNDFPGWQIRVPTAGGILSELITLGSHGGAAGGGGGNPLIWWVGLTQPPHRGFIWNYLDPDNPDLETGPIPGLILGDIITGW